VPKEGLRCIGRLGAEEMRITVVGAVLIVAAVAAGVILILALKEYTNGIGEQQNDGAQQNPSLQNGLGL
jgi:hypothetical protein